MYLCLSLIAVVAKEHGPELFFVSSPDRRRRVKGLPEMPQSSRRGFIGLIRLEAYNVRVQVPRNHILF